MTWPETADLENLVAHFRARTLPKLEWTHTAHLAVATWHIRQLGAERALEVLRAGIRSLNDAHGTVNSDASGYHETITRAYVQLIAEVIAQCGTGSTPAECARVVLSSPVAAKDALLAYYSREFLMSVAARREWAGPDLAPLLPPSTQGGQPRFSPGPNAERSRA